MRPLKGFRMFIVAVPALAEAYAIEAWTAWPAVRIYLFASAAGLFALLVLQSVYYFHFKLESEIGEQVEYLTEDAGVDPAPRVVPDPEPQPRLRIHRS